MNVDDHEWVKKTTLIFSGFFIFCVGWLKYTHKNAKWKKLIRGEEGAECDI